MNNNIIKITDLIQKYNCQKFFVLDTNQDGLAEKITYNDGDITYNRYCYGTNRYNKLEPNSIFLYRQTKRSSRNRKFYFFGGGIIKRIDSIGNGDSVEARITDGFKLSEPIFEDDERLNNIVWTSKNKKANTWDHFWNQYGMNEITKEEFLSIIGNTECFDAESFYKEKFLSEFTEEDKTINVLKKDIKDFTGTYVDASSSRIVRKSNVSKSSPRHINFEELNKKKKTVGTFGELLIVNDEIEKLNIIGIDKEVEHVAITQGDGLGYDIVSYDEKGEKMYIEVKTTSTDRIDNFYLSPKEIEMANNENYRIYRVYNLDMKTGEYDVMIFDNYDIQKLFKYVPVSYRVEFK